MDTIRIGGVPEHFNLPIHLAIEQGQFAERGVEAVWTTFDGGTGQMTKALREGEIDVCILLTEGIIKDIIHGNPSKLISAYVNSPLTWGIHTGYDNQLRHHEDIYDQRYAISRFGSGSHLMAIVDATQEDRQISQEQFVVIKNLDGALTSLSEGETDVFYWEKYTTKPYVDSGQLRRIGEFVTPWPCFMVAATDDILQRAPSAVIRMLRTIHDACDVFMQDEANIDLVAERYGQRPQDVEKWYHSTEWAIHGWINDKMIHNVTYHLQVAGIIEERYAPSQLVWDRRST